MCKVLEIAKSSYYHGRQKNASTRYIRRKELTIKIKRIYFSSKKIYGAPKIHKELLKSGEKCSLKLVQRIMKKEGLRSIVIKRYRPLSKNISREEIGRNILSRDFSSNAPGTKIVGDITYIHTVNDGWCYLASFMDLYSKKIVGWAYGKE